MAMVGSPAASLTQITRLRGTSASAWPPVRRLAKHINIAFGGWDLLIDIYYALAGALGKNIEPHFGPDRAGDIKHSNADISKANRMLRYDPEYSFADGIALAIDWYKDNL